MESKATPEIFTADQVSVRSREAMALHDRACRAYDLATDAINALLQPGSHQLLAEAFAGDADVFLGKLRLLTSATKQLAAEIKASSAIRKEEQPS